MVNKQQKINKETIKIVNNRTKLLLDFEDRIKLSEKTSLSKINDAFVEITETTYNPGGLFSFSYIEYTVETLPFGWSVERREQDFKKLRDYIIKKFPQFVVPPLLQTKSFFSQSDVETNKIFFKEFLCALLNNPEFWAWKYLEEFLSINDSTGFKEVSKMREKELAPSTLKDYSNLVGRAKLTIQWQNPKILNWYNEFFIDRYEELMKRMKESLTNIQIKSEELANQMSSFGELFDQLNSLFIDSGFDWGKDLYNDVKLLAEVFKDSVLQQTESIKNHLDVTANFHLLESNSFRELAKHKDDMYWEYYKYEKDLQSK